MFDICGMDCFQGNKVILAHWVVLSVQLVVVIVLIVYGVNGKQEMDNSKHNGSGVPYYIGAFLASGVYGALAVSTCVMLIMYKLDAETGSDAIFCTVCIFTFLGLPTFLISMVFTVVFGIDKCKTDEHTTYDRGGSCSYVDNIDKNYKIATVCLVLILLLFLTNLVGIFLLCKYGASSGSSISNGATVATSSGGNSEGGNPTLKKMVKDRERRNDIAKQIRMGKPRNMIVRRF